MATLKIDTQAIGEGHHWLSPLGRMSRERRAEITGRVRARWLARKNVPNFRLNPTRAPDVLLRRRPSADDGENEEAAWQRHRYQHQRAPEPTKMGESGQLAAWKAALAMLDASEPPLRDLIERRLAQVRSRRLGDVGVIAKSLMKPIGQIRSRAIKAAFREVRKRLGNRKISNLSLTQWAQFFLREDLKAIEGAIRTGLLGGADSAQIARRVVGSAKLNGTDGTTEQTRHKIAHLARAAMKAARTA